MADETYKFVAILLDYFDECVKFNETTTAEISEEKELIDVLIRGKKRKNKVYQLSNHLVMNRVMTVCLRIIFSSS